MAGKFQLIDGGLGNQRAAIVDENNHLGVATYEPTLYLDGKPSKFQFYSQYLGSTGVIAEAIPNGNADMGVVGAPSSFFISADADFDIRIMQVVITIADTGVAHNTFGGVAALTVGWDLFLEEAGTKTFLINKAKTSGRVIEQSGGFSPFGAGATSWQLTKWTANEDAHVIQFNIGGLVPGGVRIGRGTKDRIVSVVNDDISGLTEMYVKVLGYRHYN